MCMMIALGVVGAAVSAVGAIAQGNAQSAAAQAQSNAYAAQAMLQHRQAHAEMMAGQREAAQKERQLNALNAKQRLGYASAGVTIEGSASDVMVDTVREGMLDVQAIQWNAEVKSGNYHYSARINEMNAESAAQAAETAKTTGMINAVSAGIGGLTSTFKGASAGAIGVGGTGTALGGFSF